MRRIPLADRHADVAQEEAQSAGIDAVAMEHRPHNRIFEQFFERRLAIKPSHRNLPRGCRIGIVAMLGTIDR
jgi:hypothetical protein